MEFVALDFETANADMSSICQIGIAHFKNKVLYKQFSTYINPEDFFDEINISIHGINESTVIDAPTFEDVAKQIYSYLDNRIVVCHTHFDRVALHKACDKYLLRLPKSTWLDSARVARRTWEQCAYKGYGIGNVCSIIGYSFNAHDALEDAKAAGHILLAAIEKTGISLLDWLNHVNKPIKKPELVSKVLSHKINNEGALYGENLVFTGSLQIPRKIAVNMAENLGCKVSNTVNKNTNILIVGDQDIKRLNGHEKSSKQRKAESLISEGNQIRILRESDFYELFSFDSQETITKKQK